MTLKKKISEKTVLELARERIAVCYDRFDHVVVSFSGGKDSTVCLNLALAEARKRKRLPLDVVFIDEEAIHPPTIEYVARVAALPDIALRWYCVPVKHRNACSKKLPYWYCWAEEDRAKWCRPLPPGALTSFPVPGFKREPFPECNRYLYPKDLGQVGIIVGLRADESLRRYQAVTRRVYDNFITLDPDAPHCSLVKPIYDWVTADVWTASQHFHWDYNRTYDIYTSVGTPRPQQRVCMPYGEEPLRSLQTYATCFPELWEKMLARVPGAATAARYARTPLYGFGASSYKPADRSWPDHIKREVAKWPEKYRAGIAHRIQQEIAMHNKGTRDPIPETKKHPITGICWTYLLMLAVRGDLKGRRKRTMMQMGKQGDDEVI